LFEFYLNFIPKTRLFENPRFSESPGGSNFRNLGGTRAR